jgi:hypothetical protein
VPPVDRIVAYRRADVPCPADAGASQQPGVVLGDLGQPLRRIEAAVDPVSAARQRQMAVAVHHPGDDSRAGSVDDDGVPGELRLVSGIPEPLDAVAGDKDAHANAQLRPGPVGQGSITVQGAHSVLRLAGLPLAGPLKDARVAGENCCQGSGLLHWARAEGSVHGATLSAC